MRHSETLQLFEQAFDYPVAYDTVEEQLGDVELNTPAGDTATVEDVLSRTDESSYRSPEALYTSLIGNLEDGFIGRKYYDDRAGTRSGLDEPQGDTVSF